MTTNVIQIGDFSIQRKTKNNAEKQCEHLKVEMDDNGGIVKCRDCHATLDPYWVLRNIAKEVNEAWEQIYYEQRSLAELQKKQVVLKAARNVEGAWRTRSMLPSCPHCQRGILPEDRLGDGLIGKEYELALRKRDAEQKADKPSR